MLHALFLLHSLLADQNALAALARAVVRLGLASLFVSAGVTVLWVLEKRAPLRRT